MWPILLAATMSQPQPLLTFEGREGPGKGKHVVLLAGDEEYRSEEAMPQLARILAERHGFRCTVLFSMNDQGEIDPERSDHQPGLESLKTADLCIMMLRFRRWPEAQMKHFVEYFESGKPILALRTSTHAFDYPGDSSNAYHRYGWRSSVWPGGFGKQVLGENWVSHWGDHGKQATRGVPEATQAGHPILRGVGDVFGPTDVYEAAPPSDAKVLLWGQVVAGMNPSDPPATGRKRTASGGEQDLNDPMMPVAWTLERKNRVFTTTMGSATDLLSEGFRRLLVNATYWCVGLESSIRADADVALVGRFEATPFGFGGFKRGMRPSDFARGG